MYKRISQLNSAHSDYQKQFDDWKQRADVERDELARKLSELEQRMHDNDAAFQNALHELEAEKKKNGFIELLIKVLTTIGMTIISGIAS